MNQQNLTITKNPDKEQYKKEILQNQKITEQHQTTLKKRFHQKIKQKISGSELKEFQRAENKIKRILMQNKIILSWLKPQHLHKVSIEEIKDWWLKTKESQQQAKILTEKI